MSTTPPAVVPFESQPPQVMKRNFFLGAINGVLFVFAETLFDPTLVVTSLANQLGASAFILGLFGPISSAGWYLPPFFVAGYVQSRPLKIAVYRGMSFIRIACWILLAAVVNLVRDPAWILISLIVAYSIASLASGIGGLPFLEVVSKTVPPARRGELFAWRLGLGGLLGITASGLVRWLLDPATPIAFPNNYGLLAIGFCLFASVSLMLFNQIKETPDANPRPSRPFRQQLHIALGIVRTSPNYRRHLLTQALLFVGVSAVPFYMVFVNRELDAPLAWVGIYLAVQMVANLLANLLFGWLSRRVGNQKVLTVGAAAGVVAAAIMTGMVLLAKPLHISGLTAAWLLTPVFAMVGIRVAAVGVASPSLMLNIVPPEERSLMIGFTQTVGGMVVLLTMTSGLIVGAAGYPALMIISLAAYIGAVLLALQIREHPDL